MCVFRQVSRLLCHVVPPCLHVCVGFAGLALLHCSCVYLEVVPEQARAETETDVICMTVQKPSPYAWHSFHCL